MCINSICKTIDKPNRSQGTPSGCMQNFHKFYKKVLSSIETLEPMLTNVL